MSKQTKVWSDLEIELLKKYYGKLQSPEIQRKYLKNRTVVAIRKKAYKIGLKSDLFISKKQKNNLKKLHLGKRHTIETKKKLSEISKRKWKDPEYKRKMLMNIRNLGLSMKGKSKSEEQRKKISKSKRGKSWGKHTNETKRKISQKIKEK